MTGKIQLILETQMENIWSQVLTAREVWGVSESMKSEHRVKSEDGVRMSVSWEGESERTTALVAHQPEKIKTRW